MSIRSTKHASHDSHNARHALPALTVCGITEVATTKHPTRVDAVYEEDEDVSSRRLTYKEVSNGPLVSLQSGIHPLLFGVDPMRELEWKLSYLNGHVPVLQGVDKAYTRPVRATLLECAGRLWSADFTFKEGSPELYDYAIKTRQEMIDRFDETFETHFDVEYNMLNVGNAVYEGYGAFGEESPTVPQFLVEEDVLELWREYLDKWTPQHADSKENKVSLPDSDVINLPDSDVINLPDSDLISLPDSEDLISLPDPDEKQYRAKMPIACLVRSKGGKYYQLYEDTLYEDTLHAFESPTHFVVPRLFFEDFNVVKEIHITEAHLRELTSPFSSRADPLYQLITSLAKSDSSAVAKQVMLNRDLRALMLTPRTTNARTSVGCTSTLKRGLPGAAGTRKKALQCDINFVNSLGAGVTHSPNSVCCFAMHYNPEDEYKDSDTQRLHSMLENLMVDAVLGIAESTATDKNGLVKCNFNKEIPKHVINAFQRVAETDNAVKVACLDYYFLEKNYYDLRYGTNWVVPKVEELLRAGVKAVILPRDGTEAGEMDKMLLQARTSSTFSSTIEYVDLDWEEALKHHPLVKASQLAFINNYDQVDYNDNQRKYWLEDGKEFVLFYKKGKGEVVKAMLHDLCALSDAGKTTLRDWVHIFVDSAGDAVAHSPNSVCCFAMNYNPEDENVDSDTQRLQSMLAHLKVDAVLANSAIRGDDVPQGLVRCNFKKNIPLRIIDAFKSATAAGHPVKVACLDYYSLEENDYSKRYGMNWVVKKVAELLGAGVKAVILPRDGTRAGEMDKMLLQASKSSKFLSNIEYVDMDWEEALEHHPLVKASQRAFIDNYHKIDYNDNQRVTVVVQGKGFVLFNQKGEGKDVKAMLHDLCALSEAGISAWLAWQNENTHSAGPSAALGEGRVDEQLGA